MRGCVACALQHKMNVRIFIHLSSSSNQLDLAARGETLPADCSEKDDHHHAGAEAATCAWQGRGFMDQRACVRVRMRRSNLIVVVDRGFRERGRLRCSAVQEGI